MDDLGARRVSAQVVVSLPRIGGSDWSLGKAAAAVGAGVFQNGLGARRAKSTFIGTDACLRGVCGQRFVAVFTGWSEFEHLLDYATDRALGIHGDLNTPPLHGHGIE